DWTGLVNIAGHDADLALAGRDDAWTIRPDQTARLFLEETHGLGHVEHRYPFGDGDDDGDAGVGSFHDRVRGSRRRHEDQARIRPRFANGLGGAVEQVEAFFLRPAFARRHGADNLCAVFAALRGVESTRLAETLDENPCGFIDENAHA